MHALSGKSAYGIAPQLQWASAVRRCPQAVACIALKRADVWGAPGSRAVGQVRSTLRDALLGVAAGSLIQVHSFDCTSC
jgi:hypothetical protein